MQKFIIKDKSIKQLSKKIIDHPTDENRDQYFAAINGWMIKNNIKPKRGDVFLISNAYRNDGRCFWNGEKIVDQYYYFDDNGSVSTEFCFPEFKIGYFKKSEEHNNYFNLRLSALGLTKDYLRNRSNYQSTKIKDLLINLDDDSSDSDDDNDDKILYLTFEYANEKYYLVAPVDIEMDNLYAETNDDDIVIFGYNLAGEEFAIKNNPYKKDNRNVIFSLEGW